MTARSRLQLYDCSRSARDLENRRVSGTSSLSGIKTSRFQEP
jgi:hypothetical protein